MNDVKVDPDKNRIFITIGSIKNEAEMGKIVKAIKLECRKLKAGITLKIKRHFVFKLLPILHALPRFSPTDQ